MNKIRTISILGPTASGKTGLSIELAHRLDGEIVSCDSMQLYREMNIGTATPTEEERDGIVHHMFDILSPEEEYSAGDYAKAASEIIADISSRGKTPIICGGTGLYYDSLMKISDFAETQADEKLRDSLYAFAEENGNEALHNRLRMIDPEAAEAIHPNNVKRVVRAIEVFELTGKTKTETDREQISGDIPYDDRAFILDYLDRAVLYSRIEKRIDIMLDEGLVEEAKALFAPGRNISRTAAAAIGYKELLPYLSGEATLEQCAEELKLATRHYAKRQIIWLRRYGEDKIRIHPDENGSAKIKTPSEIADEVMKYL